MNRDLFWALYLALCCWGNAYIAGYAGHPIFSMCVSVLCGLACVGRVWLYMRNRT